MKKSTEVSNYGKLICNVFGWDAVKIGIIRAKHYAKIVRIRIYSGPYFPAFGLNTDQNNSEYGKMIGCSRISSL